MDLVVCSMVCRAWLAYVDGRALRERWDEIRKAGQRGGFVFERFDRNTFGRRPFIRYKITLPPFPTAAWFVSDATTHNQKLTLIGGELRRIIHRRGDEYTVAFPKQWDPQGERVLFFIIRKFHVIVPDHPDVQLLGSEVHEWRIPRDEMMEHAALAVLFIPYLKWITTGDHQ